jgi:hypothetical protein
MQKEKEMEKQTNINAGIMVKNPIARMSISRFPKTLRTVGEFMAMVGKDSNKRKEKKKFKTFFATVSAIKFMLQTVKICTVSLNQQVTPIGI